MFLFVLGSRLLSWDIFSDNQICDVDEMSSRWSERSPWGQCLISFLWCQVPIVVRSIMNATNWTFKSDPGNFVSFSEIPHLPFSFCLWHPWVASLKGSKNTSKSNLILKMCSLQVLSLNEGHSILSGIYMSARTRNARTRKWYFTVDKTCNQLIIDHTFFCKQRCGDLVLLFYYSLF